MCEQRRLDSHHHRHLHISAALTCALNGSKNFRGILHFILPDTVCSAHSGQHCGHLRPAGVCPRSEDEQGARSSCSGSVGDGEQRLPILLYFSII